MSRKGNRGRGNGQVPQQPLAAARPTMMIEVAVSGIQGTQLYNVQTARELHHELGLALASLEAPASDPADPEIPQLTGIPSPDDRDPEADESEPLAADGDSPPDA